MKKKMPKTFNIKSEISVVAKKAKRSGVLDI